MNMKTSGIGCQGVIEGVVLAKEGKKTFSIRKSDGEIITETREQKKESERSVFFRIPLVRGIAVFFDRLVWGTRNLFYSSSFSEEEETKDSQKKEDEESGIGVQEEQEGGSGKEFVAGLMLFVAFVAAAGLFMMLPYFLSTVLDDYIKSALLYTLLESGIRLVIFLAFLAFVARRPAMKRIFMYQAAGHKLVNCLENGLEPTLANVKAQSRKNRDSNSSFLLYVFLISIVLFMFVQVEISWLRVAVRLFIIPAVAAVLFEVEYFARRSRCVLANFLNLFRMAMQGAVVVEPEEEMLRVAVEAGHRAFDWRAVVKELEEKTEKAEPEGETEGQEAVSAKVKAESAVGLEEAAENGETEEIKETGEEGASSKVIRFSEIKKQSQKTLEEARGQTADGEGVEQEFTKHKVVKVGVRGKAGSRRSIPYIMDPGEEERQKDARWREQMKEFGGEDEEDEILSALDRFFDEKDE